MLQIFHKSYDHFPYKYVSGKNFPIVKYFPGYGVLSSGVNLGQATRHKRTLFAASHSEGIHAAFERERFTLIDLVVSLLEILPKILGFTFQIFFKVFFSALQYCCFIWVVFSRLLNFLKNLGF